VRESRRRGSALFSQRAVLLGGWAVLWWASQRAACLTMSAANPFATLGGSDVSSEEEVEPEPVSGCAIDVGERHAACASMPAFARA
jgi:hypothetical protein